jgi:hypothetical protein
VRLSVGGEAGRGSGSSHQRPIMVLHIAARIDRCISLLIEHMIDIDHHSSSGTNLVENDPDFLDADTTRFVPSSE